MKTGDILEKLITFIYDQYSQSDVIKAHGEYASIVLTQFIRNSQIDLGDARARMEYIRLLRKIGFIEIISVDGNSRPGARLFSYSRIKPTPQGIEHVESRRNPAKLLIKAVPTIAEIIGRGIKGVMGS